MTQHQTEFNFLSFVEIRTKLASLIPFILGLLYVKYRFDVFKLDRALLMLISLSCIDMATTAINNHCDNKRARRLSPINTTDVAIPQRETQERLIIAALLLVAVLSGAYLAYLSDVVVLLLGALSFGIGVLYSYGPIPISHTPLGELFSGGFMGLLIPLITIHSQLAPTGFIDLNISASQLILTLQWQELFYVICYSVVLICSIANIMLANNICDLADDLANGRHTLVSHLGTTNSLRLFKYLNVLAFVGWLVLIILKVLPLFNIIYLLLLAPIWQSSKLFLQRQNKAQTFVISIKNFMIFGIGATIIMFFNIFL